MQVTLSARPLPDFTKSEREDVKFYTRFIKCHFINLQYLLNKDYMYNPFGYVGMEQGLHNICSNAQFVVLDIDYTSVDIHTRLQQLADEDLECILGTTSDSTNLFKYRILIPLNREVTSSEYRRLIIGIREFGLIPDLDRASEKPSQKFYSYADSVIFYNKGSPLVVDNYIVTEPEVVELDLSNTTLELHEILAEFSTYTTAPPGSRTRYLLSAAFNLVERGADFELLEQVILHLNNSFLIPKSSSEVYRRVINFIKERKYK